MIMTQTIVRNKRSKEFFRKKSCYSQNKKIQTKKVERLKKRNVFCCFPFFFRQKRGKKGEKGNEGKDKKTTSFFRFFSVLPFCLTI